MLSGGSATTNNALSIPGMIVSNHICFPPVNALYAFIRVSHSFTVSSVKFTVTAKEPPESIPQPEIGQNELLTVEMNLTIVEKKAPDTKVDFTPGE